jgi:hypothetical protein
VRKALSKEAAIRPYNVKSPEARKKISLAQRPKSVKKWQS